MTYDIDRDAGFLTDLRSLNAALRAGLEASGGDVRVNGNVCHGTDEDFMADALSPKMRRKRLAMAEAARRSRHLVEVGVSGGHGLLVALHANPEIKCLGIDLARQLKPHWPPVDRIVPIAAAWLCARFGERVEIRIGDAREQLASHAESTPLRVDMLHLDAGKDGREAELEAIWPALAPRAYLIQGDALNRKVRESSAAMVRRKQARTVDPETFGYEPQRLFQLLEVGPALHPVPRSLADLEGRRVLVCVSHQDDETLFAGSLLQQLKGRADTTVATFFRPVPGRKDSDTRAAAFERACAAVGASAIQLPFAVEPEHPSLWEHVRLETEPPRLRGRKVRPVRRHPLFASLRQAATGLIRQTDADVIVTHNASGEYGHREHVMLHHAVTDAADRCGGAHVLYFGHGATGADLVVETQSAAKEALFDIYRPAWDGPRLYDFALKDETFVIGRAA